MVRGSLSPSPKLAGKRKKGGGGGLVRADSKIRRKDSKKQLRGEGTPSVVVGGFEPKRKTQRRFWGGKVRIIGRTQRGR